MRALVSILCATLVVLLPRAAFAYTFTDPTGDFRAPLEPAAGEKLCVGVPTGAADAASCQGVDIDALGKFASGQKNVTVSAVAMIRASSGMTLFIALHMRGGVDLEHADQLAAGLERGERASLPPDVRTLKNEHHTATVAGRTALIVDIDFDIPAASPLHALFGHARYIDVPAGDVDYTLSFTGSVENAAVTNAIAGRVIDKLSLAPPSVPPSATKTDAPSHDTSKTSLDDPPPGPSDSSFRSGERIGEVIGFSIIPILVIVGIILAVRKKPQPAYPAAWYPPPGYPPQGYGPQAYGPQGNPGQGYGPQGYPPGGPAQGYPQHGPWTAPPAYGYGAPPAAPPDAPGPAYGPEGQAQTPWPPQGQPPGSFNPPGGSGTPS